MNNLKDNLVLTCNNMYLLDDSNILKDFSQEQMTKSETYTNVEKDLVFTPLFDKAMLFDMSEKQSLLSLVHWLNSEYGDKTTFFTVGTPIVEVEQIVEDSVEGKED